MTLLFERIEDVRSLAQIIVETVREPLLVLDHDLKILVASASFHKIFDIDPKDTPNQLLFALDDRAWDIPALHTLLENSLADQAVVEGFLVEQAFPRIGRHIFLLHARKVLDTKVGQSLILLGFEDITGRRAIERDKELLKKQTDDLLLQKEMLLAEMQHRIVNSLQIIASILMLKARAVSSEESREHLKDAHRRVMSVAAVQQHLHVPGRLFAGQRDAPDVVHPPQLDLGRRVRRHAHPVVVVARQLEGRQQVVHAALDQAYLSAQGPRAPDAL